MRALRKSVHRPWSPAVPEWAVKLGARYIMRADPNLILSGRRCVPKKFLSEGYQMKHPDLALTLREMTWPRRSVY
jgi:hypothetical protein